MAADVPSGFDGLARSLGIEFVAEGVELEEQRAALQALGEVKIQGYLLGRPMPLEDFIARRKALSSQGLRALEALV